MLLIGRHYRVYVNNVYMFMKGSNWIPAHILPEYVTPKYTRNLMQAAADTYQNCIRVWGGGIYETDVFYQVMTSGVFFLVSARERETSVVLRAQLV